MIKAEDVVKMLSTHDVYSLLVELGADPKEEGNGITSRTRCHNPEHEGKHKLSYDSQSKSFRCWTGCGSMSIFDLISKIMGTTFYQSLMFVCSKFGIQANAVEGFPIDLVDNSFIQKLNKRKEIPYVKILDPKILRFYYDLYHTSWINDGMNVESMKKFNIKFSISDNQIIIPHFNIDNELIGVRSRNLDEKLVADGKKYMPVLYKGEMLKHPTGAALYGLNVTKENIKKMKTIILFESEKSVIQLDTMRPDLSIGACVSGSNLTEYQVDILNSLDVDEVIIAPDKEFEEIGSKMEKFYAEKVEKTFIDKLSPKFKVSVIWDTENLIDLKDSPTDKGVDIFNKLFQERIRIV